MKEKYERQVSKLKQRLIHEEKIREMHDDLMVQVSATATVTATTAVTVTVTVTVTATIVTRGGAHILSRYVTLLTDNCTHGGLSGEISGLRK